MKDVYFLLQKKFRFLETPFPDDNRLGNKLAIVGIKHENIPSPTCSSLSSKVIFLSNIFNLLILSKD